MAVLSLLCVTYSAQRGWYMYVSRLVEETEALDNHLVTIDGA